MSEEKKQPNNDFSKILNTAFSGVTGMVGDVKNQMNMKIESYLSNLDLVKREEFEVLKEMLIQSRKEQQHLSERLEALEKKSKE